MLARQTSSHLGLATPPDGGVFIPFQQRKKLQLSTVKSFSEGHTVERDSWSERTCDGPVSALTPLPAPNFSCSVASSGRSCHKTFWDKGKHKRRQKGMREAGTARGPGTHRPLPHILPSDKKRPGGRMQGAIRHPPLLHPVLSQGCSPSVLILRAVRTKANRVALNMTVPSLLRGMFMATSLCKHKEVSQQKANDG